MNAQVATTTVQGTVYSADGSAASGTLLVSWPAFSTASNQEVAAGSISTIIGANGLVSLNLAPNIGAYPAGTYYTAVYHLNDGTVNREYWVVPAVTSTAISSVRANLAPAAVAVQYVSKSYVDAAMAATTGNFVPLVGGTMSGPLQLSGDPVSTDQATTKHYADSLAATELPLAGGSLSGTLNSPNTVNKLPRVDVRHPDFGVGCANAVDPTGQQDSTCAIQAAIAWATANPQGRTYPDIYFPAGTYKISAPLRATCYLHLLGDGPDATLIEPVGNSSNAFTIYNGSEVQPDVFTCNGSLENMAIYAPGGHLYTASLIELDNASGYTLYRVRGANSGGRGLATAGNTERLKVIDTEWDTDRWPVVALGNELKFLDTQIASAGVDYTNYCYDLNCVNGVFPGDSWAVAQQLISATGNGSTATYVVKGGSDSGSTNGISPLLAGHYFTVAGIPDVTGLNGMYQITSVINNSPIGGEYTVTAANTASGTATVTGATYKPTILADNRAAAFYMSGADINVLGGSIKANWHEGCFEAQTVFSGLIQGFYCEGYPVNGQPHMEADILANGLLPWTSTTGPIASNAMPVASTQWFPAYINDPNDFGSVETNSLSYEILPEDFVKGSTSPSAYVPGVQQGQYETVSGMFSGDGQFHIYQRNLSGSTAPANTGWPAGSIIAQTPEGNYGVLQVSNSHLEDIDPPASNWAIGCNDTNNFICGEAIVGSIPNGYTTFSRGGGAPGISVDFDNDEWWGSCAANENIGQGCVKVSIGGNVTESGGGSPIMPGESSEVSNGQFVGTSNVYAVQEADGSYAWTQYSNPTSMQAGNTTNGPFYEGLVDHIGDSILGSNPNSPFAMGHQFAGSSCWYDIPPSGQTHGLNRFCAKGGPSNTGSNAGWEYDVWNGSKWVNAFGLSAQSSSTANAAVSGILMAAEIRSTGGLALSTVLNTASTLTLTAANKNVIANAMSGAQTITLPNCYTPGPDGASPTGLEFTIIKSDTSSNAVTLHTVSSQQINYAGMLVQSLSITSAGKRTLVCGPDHNWYAY